MPCGASWPSFRAQPLLIILNCLPVGMLLLVFTCLLRNVFFAGALANFAVCALSIANRIKIEVRDEPVFPRDFALLKEAGSAVGTYDIQFPGAVHRRRRGVLAGAGGPGALRGQPPLPHRPAPRLGGKPAGGLPPALPCWAD